MGNSISDTGEFGLIHRIRELLRKEGCSVPGLSVDIGDDTASILPKAGHEVLITCDSMVEGRHYLPSRISPHDLGRRAMVSNISDVGAMGGVPLYALVSLGLRGDMPVDYIEALYRGFLAELNPFGASIIGGNLTRTDERVFIDITLLGEVAEGRAVRRSTARVGDTILVTGYPGCSAAGLRLLLGNEKEPGVEEPPLVRAYNRPSHRARAGHALGLTGCVSAMIDTSDGFLGDLGHICEESGVGALLFQEKLPVREDLRMASTKLGLDPYDLVLGDSDDYELIFTCRPCDVETARNALRGLIPVPVAAVGEILPPAEGIGLVLPEGRVKKLKAIGWDHFSAPAPAS